MALRLFESTQDRPMGATGALVLDELDGKSKGILLKNLQGGVFVNVVADAHLKLSLHVRFKAAQRPKNVFIFVVDGNEDGQ
jgi:hypothetical protein